jgi:hypothetical protein
MYLFFCAVVLIFSGNGWTDILGNPGIQVGKKNLNVGIEYTTITHTFDIDTNDIDTFSERIMLKATTGLTDWCDLYIKGGGANLRLNYKDNNYAYNNLGTSVKDFNSDFSGGIGTGLRLRLLNFVNSGTRVFFQGDCFAFQTKDTIVWNRLDGSVFTKDRDMKWGDIYLALGISRQIDFVDLTLGVGYTTIWWEIEDVDVEEHFNPSSVSKTPLEKRDSWETKNPIFGFVGMDFVLPREYRISIQAGISDLNNAEFGIAVSQGLEKE